MMTLAVRLLVWGHRLGGDSDPVYRLGGAVLSAALGLGHIDPALVAEALGRLVRTGPSSAPPKTKKTSPTSSSDSASSKIRSPNLGVTDFRASSGRAYMSGDGPP